MIFRRIKAHVAKENWLAIFIDFLIVVAGILIAFQITSWNQTRADSALETEYLERIYFDMVRSIDGTKLDEPWREERIASQETVLKSLRTKTLAPEDKKQFDLGLAFFGYVDPPDRNWQTIQELQSTGRMTILSDPNLRDLIGQMETRYNTRLGRNNMTRADRQAHRIRTNDRWQFLESDYATGGETRISYDFEALANSPEFLNRLSHIHSSTILLIFDKKDDLTDFITLRDAVVKNLGYTPEILAPDEKEN